MENTGQSAELFFEILTEGYAFYRILERRQEIVTAERSFILIHKQTRQIIVDKALCKSKRTSFSLIGHQSILMQMKTTVFIRLFEKVGEKRQGRDITVVLIFL